MFDSFFDGLSRVNPDLLVLSVLGGVVFAIFYHLKAPLASPKRQLLIGALVFLTYIGPQVLDNVIDFHRNGGEAARVWLHNLSPTIRWWTFIFTSVAAIAIIQWWTRRNNDRLP